MCHIILFGHQIGYIQLWLYNVFVNIHSHSQTLRLLPGPGKTEVKCSAVPSAMPWQGRLCEIINDTDKK